MACDPGYYGDNCSEVCQCANNAECINTNGSCVCVLGYEGTNCDTRSE